MIFLWLTSGTRQKFFFDITDHTRKGLPYAVFLSSSWRTIIVYTVTSIRRRVLWTKKFWEYFRWCTWLHSFRFILKLTATDIGSCQFCRVCCLCSLWCAFSHHQEACAVVLAVSGTFFYVCTNLVRYKMLVRNQQIRTRIQLLCLDIEHSTVGKIGDSWLTP